MKMIKKTLAFTVGLVMMGGAASFAQSLADAKKAIDAEQYQKATSMLKTLVNSDPKEGDVYFNLGNVYLINEEVDSAKAIFSKGTTADPKNALNYVGLGHADLYTGNAAGAKANFDKAIDLGKKDYATYMYIGRAYFEQPKPDYAAALPNLQKADELDSKDKYPEVFIALGDYYANQKQNGPAYQKYLLATDIDPNIKRVKVQIGRMFNMADGYAEAEAKVNEVIAADPNYGPAYRELAEIQNRWSFRDPAVSKAKREESLKNYKKYLDLTDRSFESRYRYAQFLLYAEDWPTLATEVATLKTDPNNPKNFILDRLRGYSAVQNKNYEQGVQNLKKLFVNAQDTARILPGDYMQLGNAYLGVGNDSLALMNLTKAVKLDSTKADALADLGKKLFDDKKYAKAAEAYKRSIDLNSANVNIANNYYFLGYSSYFAYAEELKSGVTPNKNLLIEADSAFSKVNQLAPGHDIEAAYLYRGRIGKILDNPETPAGLAVPHLLKYIEVLTVLRPEKATVPTNIKNLIDTYNYLGSYYSASDKEKAKEYLNKTLALDPQNAYATSSLKILNTPSPSPKK
ncbi:Tetratricopeptide repeat-containing protein [Pedobacter insulae]|uniref:Tetratricopeptide repeat-containing protein n=2 Tax=Pedobacter insulae TaxID=414048 RepID=A0A1I2T1U9_9SPHI|nr:Tetratricopeptide repeat-containing protein [Pedobacter insulae]